jgi:hypothetical protein
MHGMQSIFGVDSEIRTIIMNLRIILVPNFHTSTKSGSNIVVKLGTIIMNLPTVAPKLHIFFVMNLFFAATKLSTSETKLPMILESMVSN